jgi:hypothetical protein
VCKKAKPLKLSPKSSENGGIRAFNDFSALTVPTSEGERYDDNMLSSNALELVRSKNYEVVTKVAKFIVDNNIKFGSAEFKSAILDGKVEKFGVDKATVNRLLQNGNFAEMQQDFKPFLYNIWNVPIKY